MIRGYAQKGAKYITLDKEAHHSKAGVSRSQIVKAGKIIVTHEYIDEFWSPILLPNQWDAS